MNLGRLLPILTTNQAMSIYQYAFNPSKSHIFKQNFFYYANCKLVAPIIHPTGYSRATLDKLKTQARLSLRFSYSFNIRYSSSYAAIVFSKRLSTSVIL